MRAQASACSSPRALVGSTTTVRPLWHASLRIDAPPILREPCSCRAQHLHLPFQPGARWTRRLVGTTRRQDRRVQTVATQDGAVRLRHGPSGRHSGSPGKEGSPSNFADVRDSIGPRMFMITGRSELPDGECLRLLAVVRVRDGGSEQVQSKMREGGRKMRALDLAQVWRDLVDALEQCEPVTPGDW